jgi:hypothetical protein
VEIINLSPKSKLSNKYYEKDLARHGLYKNISKSSSYHQYPYNLELESYKIINV